MGAPPVAPPVIDQQQVQAAQLAAQQAWQQRVSSSLQVLCVWPLVILLYSSITSRVIFCSATS